MYDKSSSIIQSMPLVYLPFGRDILLCEDLTLHLQAPKEIKNN